MTKNAHLRKHFNNWKKSKSGQVAIDTMKKRQYWLCPSCMVDITANYHVHHTFPISKMSETDYEKSIDYKLMVLLCPSCNKKQGAKIDYRFD